MSLWCSSLRFGCTSNRKMCTVGLSKRPFALLIRVRGQKHKSTLKFIVCVLITLNQFLFHNKTNGIMRLAKKINGCLFIAEVNAMMKDSSWRRTVRGHDTGNTLVGSRLSPRATPLYPAQVLRLNYLHKTKYRLRNHPPQSSVFSWPIPAPMNLPKRDCKNSTAWTVYFNKNLFSTSCLRSLLINDVSYAG